MLFNVILLYAEVFSVPGYWCQLRSEKGLKILFKGFLNRLAEKKDKTSLQGHPLLGPQSLRTYACYYFRGALPVRLSAMATSAYSVKTCGK
jgi:hypothetical protein